MTTGIQTLKLTALQIRTESQHKSHDELCVRHLHDVVYTEIFHAGRKPITLNIPAK